MASDKQQMPVQVPKLSPDSSNWVTYRDRLKWAMQANSFEDHAKVSLPLAEYTTLSTVGGVTLAA